MYGGKALVKIFERAGVDYIFSSPGTEWPPVWEALAEAREHGNQGIGFINCRHEALAVAIASGYTKVTGRPQAVLLHATAERGDVSAGRVSGESPYGYLLRRIRCLWGGTPAAGPRESVGS